MKTITSTLILTPLLVLFCIVAKAGAADIPKQPIPDLIKGEELDRVNDLNIGPIGIWTEIWRARQRSNEHNFIRQFVVRKIHKGSPADGVLEVGDVVLGVNASGAAEVQPFPSHPQKLMAEAINEAEAKDPALLKLLIWRPATKPKTGSDKEKDKNKAELRTSIDQSGDALDDNPDDPVTENKAAVKKETGKKINGSMLTVTVKLETMGAYSETAPYNCPKSKKILRKGIKALYEELKDTEGGDSSGMAMMLLLAADDPTNPDNDKYQAKAREWAHSRIVSSRAEILHSPWYHGYNMISLAEYYMKTKDEKVFETLTFYAQEWARKSSWFGTTGHRWSEKKDDGTMGGRISGYGPILASALPGFLGMVMAREAGVDSPEVNEAIKRSDVFFASYALKGVYPYGEHGFGYGGTDEYDINGKTSVAGFAFALLPHRQEEARWASKISAAADKGRYYAHGGPYPAQLWNPIGAAIGGTKSASLHFHNVSWHMDLNREWDGKFYYDGKQGWNGFSNASTVLFACALPLKQLYITGRNHKKSWLLSDEEVESIKESKIFDASKKSTEELMKELSSWAGYNRMKSAEELANRAKDPKLKNALLPRLHKLAQDKNAEPMARTGACVILQNILDNSSIDVLVTALTDENALVKVMAAKSLGQFPRQEVIPHINTILDLAATTIKPTFPLQEGDPLQYAHGQLGELLFGSKGLLKDNIDGIDRKKLLAAGRGVAKNPAGGFRSCVSALYRHLNEEEALLLSETIIEGIRVPAPADSMFAGGIINDGMNILSKYSIEEGLLLGSTMKIEDRIKVLSAYDLSSLSDEMTSKVLHDLGDIQLIEGIDTSMVLKAMKNSQNKKPLTKLKKINSVKAAAQVVKLPENETSLEVFSINYSRLDPKETTYTWRKIYGPGKVSFSSNQSWESNKTTVKFVDCKAGKYRFEVTMSDSLGYYDIKAELDLELQDKNGANLQNKKPAVQPLYVDAVNGIPQQLTLKGSDPDDDELGFIVTQKPKHGKLSGFGANLSYTANFAYNGKDSFTYEALDGKGGVATGTVEIKISDSDVPVAIYEGFDYLTLSLKEDDNDLLGELNNTISIVDNNAAEAKFVNGLGNKKSHGFSTPWKVTNNDKSYALHNKSLALYGIPASGISVQGNSNHRMMYRTLDNSVISKYKLLSNSGELWFSAIIQTKKDSRFEFGFKTSENSDGKERLSIITDRGLKLKKDNEAIASQPWNRGSDAIKYPDNQPWMLVGHCQWGKTDKDPDIIQIYRVLIVPDFGPVVILKRPVLFSDTELINQEKLSDFFFTSSGSLIDEIRIGSSFNSVLMGTKPQK